MKINGGILFRELENQTEQFNKFMENSTLEFFSSGSIGMIFKATISNNTYKTPYINESGNKVSTIIFKLSFIEENQKELLLDSKPYGIVTETSFNNELNIQNKIHKKSTEYNNNKESICPTIIYSQIIENPKITDFVDYLLEKIYIDSYGADLLRLIKDKTERYNTLRIGVIAMEYADGYFRLYDLLNKGENKAYILMMAFYLLIKLYNLGYTHGDHHGGNILINIKDGKSMIIDFGKTQEITNNMYVDTRTEFTLSRNHQYRMENAEEQLEELKRNNNYVDILKYLNRIITPDAIYLLDHKNLYGYSSIHSTWANYVNEVISSEMEHDNNTEHDNNMETTWDMDIERTGGNDSSKVRSLCGISKKRNTKLKNSKRTKYSSQKKRITRKRK